MSELVTRAILKEELKNELETFRADMQATFAEARVQTRADIKAAIEEARVQTQADTMSALRMVQADLERNLGLALEPSKDLPDRVTKLEDLPDRVTTLELLPDRVTKLEAKVFPPKRATRRR